MVWAPEEHFDRHIPLVLLTGFLGSGKTSLLNWLLHDPALTDTAIAINEFGAVPLDHNFVQAAADDVVLLPNGCLCCFASDDLEGALARLFQRTASGELPPFKRLILEASGLADPEFILQRILESPIGSRFLWLDRIVTMVDAIHGYGQLCRHPEARKQVRLADQILISKTDMADRSTVDTLIAHIEDMNIVAAIADSNPAVLTLADVVSPLFVDPDEEQSMLGNWAVSLEKAGIAGRTDQPDGHGNNHQEHAHTQAVSTMVRTETPVDWRQFQLWFGRMQRTLGERLLRAKGLVQVAGHDKPVVVHAVQSTQHVPVSLEQWPDDDRSTRIMFIIDGGNPEDLLESWDAFTSREIA